MDCTECRWADAAKAPRTLAVGQMRITQPKGGITCTRGSIKELAITDDGTSCSEFEERKAGKNGMAAQPGRRKG